MLGGGSPVADAQGAIPAAPADVIQVATPAWVVAQDEAGLVGLAVEAVAQDEVALVELPVEAAAQDETGLAGILGEVARVWPLAWVEALDGFPVEVAPQDETVLAGAVAPVGSPV
jgi:hypothetical protein